MSWIFESGFDGGILEFRENLVDCHPCKVRGKKFGLLLGIAICAMGAIAGLDLRLSDGLVSIPMFPKVAGYSLDHCGKLR